MCYFSREPISLDDAARRVPALLASPHASRSSRYEHIPTIRVLEALTKEGFNIHGLTTATVRQDDRNGYQKHLVRLRKPHDVTAAEAPEVILINSHDGSCAYQLKAGLFRFACANGIIVGQDWKSVSVPHKGRDTIPTVIEGTYEVVDEFDRLGGAVDSWKRIALEPREQEAFAQVAIEYRYGDEGKAPVTPQALLRARRQEDVGADLWRTFNRVQEGMLKGGLRGKVTDQETGRTRRASVREIRGIDGQVRLNQALWALAERLAEIKDRPQHQAA